MISELYASSVAAVHPSRASGIIGRAARPRSIDEDETSASKGCGQGVWTPDPVVDDSDSRKEVSCRNVWHRRVEVSNRAINDTPAFCTEG